MEHLVEGHMNGYWIDNRDIEDIQEECEECGDYDRVLLSWQEGQMIDALKKYFSDLKVMRSTIEENHKSGITKPEIIESSLSYYEDDKNIIRSLFLDKHINKEEYKELLMTIKSSQKEQINLILDVYSIDKSKKLTLKQNNNKK